MLQKIFCLIFLLCSALSLSCRTLPTFTEDTELTFIDDLTIISETKQLFITRLKTKKLFEINGNSYDYDTLFTNKPRQVYWVENTKKPYSPRGFLYDLDNDTLIKPIGYTKHSLTPS